MDLQLVLRWLIIAIVVVVALSLLSVLLKVAGMLLPYALKALIILFLVAVAIRFYSLLDRKKG